MKSRKNRKDVSQNVSRTKQDTIKFKNRDLEIDNILEETRFLTEKGEMEETAKKYRARPKWDEIFSNASKEIRYTNNNPLEMDLEEKNHAPADEETAATVRAQMILDGTEEKETSEKAKAESDETISTDAQQKEAQAKPKEKEAEEDDPVVTLKPEFTENTKFAEDVISEVEEFHERKVTVTDYDSIDIDLELDEKNTEKAIENFSEETGEKEKQKKEDRQGRDPEQLKEEIKGNYEKLFGIKKPKTQIIISRVPVYTLEASVNKVHVKAGKFSSVVRTEYEQYLKSNDPRVARVVKMEKEEELDQNPPKDTRPFKEKVLNAVVGFFSSEENQIGQDVPEEKIETVDDYTSREDAKSILLEINANIRKLFIRSLIMGVIALFSLVVTVLVRLIPETLCASVANAPIVYAVVNLFLTGLAIGVNRVTILSGLTPLAKFRGNSDTALAAASVAAGLQAVVSFFFIIGAENFAINYYSVILIVGFFANTLGKLFMVLRVKDNFKFVSSSAPAYAAKIYTDENIAAKMMSGTVVERPIVAYQHKTGFLSNFLKISYAPDPSEELAGKLAPVTLLCSLAVAVAYGVMFQSFGGAVDAFSVMAAVSIPVSTLLAVNIPLRSFCKKLKKYNTMVSSYLSVKQFCDTTAVMADANDLYPEGSITLDGIKTFTEHGADEAILACAAVLREAESPLASAFDKTIDRGQGLPRVESVLYEDEMGLVGWVRGERILVGSRSLMEKYNIDTPSADYEEKYHLEDKEITYLSRAGQLVAMFVVKYHADPAVMEELHRGELNGISFLVRTTDCNITSERIAEDFGIFFRSVKVLPTGLGSVCKEVREQTEETSRAYLATRGHFTALLRGVTGCVKLSSNISLTVVIQLISVVLGILLTALLCLYAGPGVLGTLEMLIYAVFWGASAVIAPLIKKP